MRARFWIISFRACVPNFKVQGHFHQKRELLESSNPCKFYKTYTAKTPLTFFRRMFVGSLIKANDNYSNLLTQSNENHVICSAKKGIYASRPWFPAPAPDPNFCLTAPALKFCLPALALNLYLPASSS